MILKILLKIIQPIRRLYWCIAKPVTRGVRALVIDDEGKVLLVKHTYLSGWYLVGGKVEKNETDEKALIRELDEEVGISDIANLTIFGEYSNTFEYKKDTVVVFIVTSFLFQPKNNFEIQEIAFFEPQNIPDDTSRGTKRRIEEWLKLKSKSTDW